MIKKLFLFSLYSYIIIENFLTICNAKISDKRLCADPNCSTTISYATTLLQYFPSEECMIQFPARAKINVMARGAGSRSDLWEIEYNGKRGFAPVSLLKETQIVKKRNEVVHVVPTHCENGEITGAAVVEQPPKVEETPIVAASAVEPFEIIDGTKVFKDEMENVTEGISANGNLVNTPNIPPPPQPPLENKPNNDLPSSPPVTDEPEDDYVSDEFDEEEEIIDDKDDENDDDVLSKEVVDNTSAEGLEIVSDVINASVEDKNETINSESISNEVKNENETLPSESQSVDAKTEAVAEVVSPPEQETTTPTQVESSDSEPLQNMYVTEIPNEIPRPILADQIVLESTTATPFSEPVVENMPPQESSPSITESLSPSITESLSSKPEEEEEISTNSQEISSEIPPVPSVEENKVSSEEETNKTNEPSLVEVPAVQQEEKEFEIKSDVVEPEEAIELNTGGPESIQEEPSVNELPETQPSPSPPVAQNSEPEAIVIDNKIEELEIVPPSSETVAEPVAPEIVEKQPLTDATPPPPEIIPPVTENVKPDLIPSVPQEIEEEIPLPPLLEEIKLENPEPEEPATASPGIFANIYAKMFGPQNDEETEKENIPVDNELERILYPEKFSRPEEQSTTASEEINPPKIVEAVEGYCENLSPNSCPQSPPHPAPERPITSHFHSAHTDAPENSTSSKGIDYEEYMKVFLDGILKMKDFIIYLTITAATVLSFIFGYYCINKCRKESPLINNLNVLERNLMVTKKENALLLGELEDIRQKLASIEDNSFGSNEMVIALKTKLDDTENQKIDYQLQVTALEKELESATEAGLELNRMVAELLNNQSGSESIISSVEELQKQLNEQQETILSINATLAEKSRENSELQVFLNEQKKQFDDDLSVLQSLNENLTEKNEELNKKIIEMTETLEVTMNEALKTKSDEIVKLNKEFGVLKKRYEESQRKVAKAESRCQVLDEYLKNAKKDATDAKEVYDLVQLKSDALAANKEKEQFRERLEGETDARKLLEDHLKVASEEVSNLKKEYNVAEKEKVEAQTRLEVLSGYFKEKETQLQKELSIKEAMWLQQQGEKTSTIERVQSMQDEIQTLKSQNDALRAEIEAQAAAHKTQLATLDSRAHEEWLNAKQAKRKLEEVRAEAAGLRRKLTTYGESGVDQTGTVNGIDGNLAPSPILMDSNPGASMLGVLPPPPFMPPPFMGPPPPFMPPPFMPGEMRPPPLGRLMSPPPNRYSPNILDDRDRYSPNRSPGRYSPDARYNYNDVLSPYETETDFSPPPSPPPRHGGFRDNRGYKAFSPPPLQSDNRNKKSKGGLSSGSTDSLPRRRGGGSGGGGDNNGPNSQNGNNKTNKV